MIGEAGSKFVDTFFKLLELLASRRIFERVVAHFRSFGVEVAPKLFVGQYKLVGGNLKILRVDLEPTSRKLRVVSTKGRPQLRYLPDGSSAGSNLTISICNNRQQLLGKVIVNNMGRPRSERPKAATPCPA